MFYFIVHVVHRSRADGWHHMKNKFHFVLCEWVRIFWVGRIFPMVMFVLLSGTEPPLTLL